MSLGLKLLYICAPINLYRSLESWVTKNFKEFFFEEVFPFHFNMYICTPFAKASIKVLFEIDLKNR